jgi:hypothetical protein
MGNSKVEGRIMGLFNPKQNPKAIGERSQVYIIARFLEVGYNVLTPYGDNRRYDLVIEDADGQFWRVQCKTGRSNGEWIAFATASSYNHTMKNKGWKHYRRQIDYFAVYCPEIRGVYLIPVDAVGMTQANLRLTPPKNGQEKYVRWAKDYEV